MKSKSYQKLCSSRNSLASIDSVKFGTTFHPSKYKKLEELKNRKQLQDPTVTNQVAARVVKDFLLPMFESKYREKSHSERVKLHGLESRRSLSIVPGTVYDELKLVENLSNEITQLKTLVSDVEQENKELVQERELVRKELDRKNQEILNMTISLQLLSDENRHLARYIQKLNQKLAFSTDRETSKKIQSQISIENVRFKQDLQDFKSKNDIRTPLNQPLNSFKSANRPDLQTRA